MVWIYGINNEVVWILGGLLWGLVYDIMTYSNMFSYIFLMIETVNSMNLLSFVFH